MDAWVILDDSTDGDASVIEPEIKDTICARDQQNDEYIARVYGDADAIQRLTDDDRVFELSEAPSDELNRIYGVDRSAAAWDRSMVSEWCC